MSFLQLTEEQPLSQVHLRERVVTLDERNVLEDAFLEEKRRLDANQPSVVEAVSSHGFSMELVTAVSDDCEHIFTVEY